MTLAYTYDGAAVTHNIAPSTVSLTSAAELGEASTSGLQIEDPGSTLTMLGHRPFVVEESACSQPRLFTGWTTSRGVGRSVGDGMFGDATAGVHDLTAIDLNALFNWRTITGTDGNRPAETFAARLAWILGSSYLSGLIEDTGYIVVNTRPMDAADYRDGYPAAVMDDLMDRSAGAYNYFAFWDPTAAAVGLWVGHLDDAVSTSTLRISNVAADVDGTTTFPPDDDARLAITPTETFSEVTVEYAHGTQRLFRSRASTATKYIQRSAKIQRPYTGSAATASTQAERFLDQHANEEDRITVTIIVPAAKAGLLTAGQRLDVKLSHLEGYTSFTSMRCVRLTVAPTNDLATHYALTLELAAPRPSPSTTAAVGFLGMRIASWPASGFWEISLEAYNGTSWVEILTGAEIAAPDNGEVRMFSSPVTAAQWRLHLTLNWDTVFMPDLLLSAAILVGSDGTDLFGNGWPPGSSAIAHRTSLSTTTFTGSGPSDGFSMEGYLGGAYDGDEYGSITIDQTRSWGLSQTDIIGNYTRTMDYYWTWVLGGSSDTEIALPPPPGAPITSTSDPTAADGAPLPVGQTWVNTTSGEAFVLVDNTAGAAVWVSTTSAGVVDHGALTGLADDDHTQYVLKRYGGKEVVSTVAAAGATETLDLANGNVHDVTLTADCTLTFAGATAGVACSFTLLLRQDGTGGWTTTWPGSVVWAGGTAPTLDETLSTVAVLTFFTLDGGTVWYGFATGGGGSAAAALDDLTDVTITAAAADDTLRYVGAAWVNDNRRWEPVTTNPGTGPEIVWDGDDIVMTWRAY